MANARQLTKYPYIIVDDTVGHAFETKALADSFQHLQYAGKAADYGSAVDLILEVQPSIVFLEINPADSESRLSLHLINEVYRYLSVLPKFIITTTTKDLAYDAMKYDVDGYILKPYDTVEFRKAILKITRDASTPVALSLPIILEPEIESEEMVAAPIQAVMESEEEMSNPETVTVSPVNRPLTICVKSYGDYRFINAEDICYLQADNNSTDIHLNNGEMITAFKTLKHFENVLKSPFVRIHNSYIVNIDYVSRIHTGNAVCYIKGTTTKLPFSKSYKENVDAILESITAGNYLEI